jgi:hypothetical protein
MTLLKETQFEINPLRPHAPLKKTIAFNSNCIEKLVHSLSLNLMKSLKKIRNPNSMQEANPKKGPCSLRPINLFTEANNTEGLSAGKK